MTLSIAYVFYDVGEFFYSHVVLKCWW